MTERRLTDEELADLVQWAAVDLREREGDAVQRAVDEIRESRAVLASIRHDIDLAIAAHDPTDPRHPSRGGQHTNGRCCPLGNLNPSAIRPLREWREAIDKLIASRNGGAR